MGCTHSSNSCLKGADDGDVTFQSNLVRVESPQKFMENYYETLKLGEGITGTVKIVVNKKTEEQFAMKTINLSRVDKAQLKELQNEIKILRQLDHPNIVRLLNTYMDKKNIYMIMELCTGGELAKKRLKTESEVKNVVSQLLLACAYCHSMGVVHRDLKLENIILANKEPNSDIKLIDFGLSARFHTDPSLPINGKSSFNQTKRMFLTTCGTAYYMAPEVVEGKYTEACDLWAIGVITFMLLTGRPPFNGRTEDEVFDKLQRGVIKYDSPVWNQVSGYAKSFVQHLLLVDPAKRWTARQALESPWIKNFHEAKRQNSVTTVGAESQLENDVVDSLQRFVSYTQLKKSALMIIAHHAGQEEIKDLKNSFLELDRERSGFITFEELKQVLERHNFSDTEEMHKLFHGLDQDRTGRIRYLEFLAATIETRCMVDQKLLGSAFDHLDADGSGYITVANMKQLLGKGFTSSEVERIVKECDLTGDNRVSRDEFLKAMAMGHDQVSADTDALISNIMVEEKIPRTRASSSVSDAKTHQNDDADDDELRDTPKPATSGDDVSKSANAAATQKSDDSQSAAASDDTVTDDGQSTTGTSETGEVAAHGGEKAVVQGAADEARKDQDAKDADNGEAGGNKAVESGQGVANIPDENQQQTDVTKAPGGNQEDVQTTQVPSSDPAPETVEAHVDDIDVST